MSVVMFVVCVCCAMKPGNYIGTEGAKALAPVLGHLTQLTKLDLDGEY